MYKRDVTAADVEGLQYRNSAGNYAKVTEDHVSSYQVRRDGVIIVKFYGYFWRERHSAWNGSVYRVRWAVKKPGVDRWFVDETRRGALEYMKESS